MTRILICVTAVLLSLPGALFSADGPTHFRKQHAIVLYAAKGENVSAEIECLPASSGYPDSATYNALDPFGRLIERGVVPVKEKRVVSFTAETTGPHMIDVNPGMNAFTIQPSTELWAVDISDRRRLNIIGHARDLYFWVPKGTKSFTLKMQGEPGKVTCATAEGP
jgi:hypothetical protein